MVKTVVRQIEIYVYERVCVHIFLRLQGFVERSWWENFFLVPLTMLNLYASESIQRNDMDDQFSDY